MLTPADPELEVTLVSVFSTLSKTPREESAKYRTATATKSMTQATNEIRKLNFITDHGSSLATTRSARRPPLPPAPAVHRRPRKPRCPQNPPGSTPKPRRSIPEARRSIPELCWVGQRVSDTARTAFLAVCTHRRPLRPDLGVLAVRVHSLPAVGVGIHVGSIRLGSVSRGIGRIGNGRVRAS